MPSIFEATQLVVAQRVKGEDRVAVFSDTARTVIVVADGAGGTGNGDLAAEAIVREVGERWQAVQGAQQWADLLRQLDHQIGTGESTAVVVDLRAEGIVGASVGDSRAWVVDHDEVLDLTQHQQRKPLLGSGESQPVSFGAGPLQGTLIVATDGLGSYVNRDEMTRLVAQADFFELPRKLVEAVRLPSGDLWDDIGIVVCRVQPTRRGRQRYDL